jgi:hypothetical protein
MTTAFDAPTNSTGFDAARMCGLLPFLDQMIGG